MTLSRLVTLSISSLINLDVEAIRSIFFNFNKIVTELDTENSVPDS